MKPRVKCYGNKAYYHDVTHDWLYKVETEHVTNSKPGAVIPYEHINNGLNRTTRYRVVGTRHS